jgi:hypothetical protein
MVTSPAAKDTKPIDGVIECLEPEAVSNWKGHVRRVDTTPLDDD